MVDVESPTPEGSPDSGEVTAGTIDITTEAFAKRLGNLLMGRRTNSKLSVRAMARRSDGHFSRKQLRQYESASLRVDAVSASALAALYRVDLDAILPLRTEITIDSGGGIISAGGVNATFEPSDPQSVLETYLRLVRRLRNQEREEVVSLRREDIEGLAAHLDQSGESVVEQLGALMGATRTQRRLMAGMFLTGAMVITIAVPSVAAFTGGDSTIDTGAAGNPPSVVVNAADGDVDPDPGVPFDGPDPVMDDDTDDDTDDDLSDLDVAGDDDVSDLDVAGDGDAALPDGDRSPSPSPSTPTPTPTPTPPSGEAAARSGSPATPSAPPASDAAGDDQVGVAPPPVPSDTPPIVEPGNGPLNLGSVPGSGASGSGSGEPEPVVEPDVAVGGPPIPSGNGNGNGNGNNDIVEPDAGPVVGDEPAPRPEVDPEAGEETNEDADDIDPANPDDGAEVDDVG